jgi:23S rRNA (adenine2503-C2)-methyltransferase
MKPYFPDMTREALRAAVAEMGEKPFRADQLADWVYAKGVTDPAGMTNLPHAFTERFEFASSRVVQRRDSTDGTCKLLVEFADGERIETALIPTDRFATACVSTQAGCGMGCEFCASGLDGLRRNLSAGEILEQLFHLWQATKRRPTHVVFMGMGEPLANYDAVVAAVKAIIDPHRFGLSARRVTVSTVGLPKQILRLAEENLPITLAISLHAPNDALRQKLIPAARQAPLEEILAAAETFFHSRGREITLEYILIAGVNDTGVCAEALSGIALRLRCSVNVILYNPVEGLPFERPSDVAVKKFVQRLAKNGVNVQVRKSRGLDADAACGQLRKRADHPAS